MNKSNYSCSARWAISGLLLLGILGPSFTWARASEKPPEPIKVFVSILPQSYFVKRVGGLHVEVEVLVGPGKSPATYEPTPKQMAKLAESSLYFRIGVPFEKGFIKKISEAFQHLKIIDMRKNVELLYFDRYSPMKRPDPHIWLDPKRVKTQAYTIYEALCHIDPEHQTFFKKNLHAFHEELDILDRKIERALAPIKGQEFYVFHPAFGYFADSYGLSQVAVEIEGKTPGPKQLAKLIEKAKEDNIGVIFVQPQYTNKEAESIATAIGGTLVPLDPLPRDYLEGIEEIALKIKNAILKRQALSTMGQGRSN